MKSVTNGTDSADIEFANSKGKMSSKSSCPTDCGPQGDIIPADETQGDCSPKHLPHYSCFKAVPNTTDDSLEEQVESTSGEPEKKPETTSCDTDKPQNKPENESCDLSDKEVAEIKEEQPKNEEQTETVIKGDGDKKQKSEETDHSSSLFNIADAKSDDIDCQNSKPFRRGIPAPNSLATPDTPNFGSPLRGGKHRNQKSPGTKSPAISPAKSPRELLQSVQEPPAAPQENYDDNATA